MLPRRRLFRATPAPRRWPALAAACLLATIGVLAVAVRLPTGLLGSTPPESSLTAAPDEVRVVDGETLRLGGRVVRLEGLDAPSRGERCADAAGHDFGCGAASADRLARLVVDQPLSCRPHGRDRLRRAFGTCEAGGTDLGSALVSGGWALANSATLSAAAGSAHAAWRGLRGGGTVPPGDRRERC